jgi:hypothetical protein
MLPAGLQEAAPAAGAEWRIADAEILVASRGDLY